MAGFFLGNAGIAIMVWGGAPLWLFGAGTLLTFLSTITMIIATRADRLYFTRRSHIRRVLLTLPLPVPVSFALFLAAPVAWIIGIATHPR